MGRIEGEKKQTNKKRWRRGREEEERGKSQENRLKYVQDIPWWKEGAFPHFLGSLEIGDIGRERCFIAKPNCREPIKGSLEA